MVSFTFEICKKNLSSRNTIQYAKRAVLGNILFFTNSSGADILALF